MTFFLLLLLMVYLHTYNRLLTRNTEAMQTAAKIYTDELGKSLHLAQEQLVRVSQDELLLELFTMQTNTPNAPQINAPQTNALLERLHWQKDMLVDTLPMIDSIAYYSANGKRITFAEDKTFAEDNFFVNMFSGLGAKNFNTRPCVLVTVPSASSTVDVNGQNASNAQNASFFMLSIKNNGQVVGYIVAKLNMQSVLSSFDLHTFGNTCSFYVVDKYSNLLFGDIDKASFDQMLMLQPKFANLFNSFYLQNLSLVRFAEPKKPQRIGIICKNTEFDFFFLLSIKNQELVSQAFSALYLVFVSSLVIILIAIVVIIYLYRRLDKPLEEMAEQCTKIKDERATVRFGHYADKSLNVLADTLNETIDSLSAYQSNLETMAFTDPLLGVGNRSACIRNLEQLIHTEKHDFSIFMVSVVDFDHFNELFSVKTGDMLLRKTSAVLDTISNSNVYRYNGDTLILLIPRADGAKCAQITHELKEYFSKPVLLSSGKYHISMDAGRADYPEHGSTATELIRSCKIALRYCQSLSARNMCIVYNSIVDDAIGRRSRIKDKIVDLINNPSDIEIVYQPIFCLKQNKFTRLEALLRLKSSDLEIHSDEVIQIAEQNGLITELGELIIGSVCQFARLVQDKAPYIETISINLSVIQILQHGFLETIKRLLTASKVPLSFFEFEVTESMVSSSFEIVKEKLEQLKALGVRLALDDFGSGLSSINYLAHLPLDTLKLNKSITISATQKGWESSLVRSLLDACKEYKFTVIAEGIETEDMRNKAQMLDVDCMQGFYYAQPLSKMRVFSFLEENRYLNQR